MLEDAAGKRDERMLLRDDMETVDLYLSLGSNKGDRRENESVLFAVSYENFKKFFLCHNSL